MSPTLVRTRGRRRAKTVTQERKKVTTEDYANWQLKHPHYAALDEFIRWDESQDGGKAPRRNNLLRHLDNVYTHEGRGPSLLKHILRMCDKHTIALCRQVSREVGAVATKLFAQSLTVRWDSFYVNEVLKTKYESKLLRFVNALNANAAPAADKTSQPLAPYFIKPEYIEEIEFRPDERYRYRLEWLMHHYASALKNQEKAEPTKEHLKWINETAKDLAKKEVDGIYALDTEAVEEAWYKTLHLVQSLSHLKSFKFAGRTAIPDALFQVLAKKGTLAKIDVAIFDMPLQNTYNFKPVGEDKRKALDIYKLGIFERENLRIGRECEVHIDIKVKKNAHLYAALRLLSKTCPIVESLKIDRSVSTPNNDSELQGGAVFPPKVRGDDGTLKTLGPTDAPKLEVRKLTLVKSDKFAQYYILGINALALQELTLVDCMYTQHVLERFVRSAKKLQSFTAVMNNSPTLPKQFSQPFVIDSHRPVNVSKRRFELWMKDQRDIFDFLRAGQFHLRALNIEGDFAERPHIRAPTQNSLLTPDLFFAIQAHLKTLRQLCVYNKGVDLTFEEFQDIGRLGAYLKDLRVVCRMGDRWYQNETYKNEGLAWRLRAGLKAFAQHKSLESFSILKSNPSGILRPMFNGQFRKNHNRVARKRCLRAVREARRAGVPLRLFSYMDDRVAEGAPGLDEHFSDVYFYWDCLEDPPDLKLTAKDKFKNYVPGKGESYRLAPDYHETCDLERFTKKHDELMKEMDINQPRPSHCENVRKRKAHDELHTRRVKRRAYDQNVFTGATLGPPAGQNPIDESHHSPYDIDEDAEPLPTPPSMLLGGENKDPVGRNGIILQINNKQYVSGFDGRLLLLRERGFPTRAEIDEALRKEEEAKRLATQIMMMEDNRTFFAVRAEGDDARVIGSLELGWEGENADGVADEAPPALKFLKSMENQLNRPSTPQSSPQSSPKGPPKPGEGKPLGCLLPEATPIYRSPASTRAPAQVYTPRGTRVQRSPAVPGSTTKRTPKSTAGGSPIQKAATMAGRRSHTPSPITTENPANTDAPWAPQTSRPPQIIVQPPTETTTQGATTSPAKPGDDAPPAPSPKGLLSPVSAGLQTLIKLAAAGTKGYKQQLPTPETTNEERHSSPEQRSTVSPNEEGATDNNTTEQVATDDNGYATKTNKATSPKKIVAPENVITFTAPKEAEEEEEQERPETPPVPATARIPGTPGTASIGMPATGTQMMHLGEETGEVVTEEGEDEMGFGRWAWEFLKGPSELRQHRRPWEKKERK